MSNFAVPQATPYPSSSSVADAVAAIPSFTASPLLRPLTTYTYTEDGVVETYVYIRHKEVCHASHPLCKQLLIYVS